MKDDYEVQMETSFLVLAVSMLIQNAMEKQGMTRADLAERMGVSRGRVTVLLDDADNMTLRTAVRLAMACGLRLRIRGRG